MILRSASGHGKVEVTFLLLSLRGRTLVVSIISSGDVRLGDRVKTEYRIGIVLEVVFF